MDTLTSLIDHRVLQAIAPRAPAKKIADQQRIIAAFGPQLPVLLPQFQISTVLRISHFLAQIAHESDGFCTTVEYASGAAYEGRTDLGNTQRGDGVRFKGRALIQNTGHANYGEFTQWMWKRVPNAPDFVKEPEKLAEFPWAGWATFWYWSTRNLNALADQDDLVAITKKINGGRNGLDDRAAYLVKAKKAVGNIDADRLGFRQNFAVLRRGVRGEAVEQLQRALRAAGIYTMSIDGIFGAGTEVAVRGFQRREHLTVDGLVGKRTWTALEPYMPREAA